MFSINNKQGPAHRDSERGQIIVILAGAMIGLLVAAGLATDAGVLFMRKAQLDRAVDAAALAGVKQLVADTDYNAALRAANTRGQQLLAANEVFTENPVGSLARCLDETDPNYDSFWDTHEYCGLRQTGSMFGATRYHIEVRWQSETFFMKLMGFDTVPLSAEATAEYMPLVDMFSSAAMESSILQSSNQAIFGPEQGCTSMGDPYTPTTSVWWSELEGVYTYRIRVPDDYPYDKVRVELFDPDTANQRQNSYETYNLAGERVTKSNGGSGCSNSRTEPCLFNQGSAEEPFWWFQRIDENRNTSCGTPGSYSPGQNTRTQYRLYYLQQNADGSLDEADIAYYTGKSDGTNASEAYATDMYWISPGAAGTERMPAYNVGETYGGSPPGGSDAASHAGDPLSVQEPYVSVDSCAGCTSNDFIIDLTTETPNIYVDPGTGSRDIFLAVKGLSGASENGFELWAGPPRSADVNQYSAPAYVNARQIYLQLKQNADTPEHQSEGIGIYGLGHLPMNSNTTNRVDIALAYLGPEFSGQTLNLNLFDADSGTRPPIAFYFDSIPRTDWMACYDDGSLAHNDCDVEQPDGPGGKEEFYRGPDQLNVNGAWANYEFVIPGESPGGSGPDNIPFYGGRLYVSYVGGDHDTYGWKMTIEGRPYLVQ